jgi:predicted RND superfamily exporter protein
MGSIVLMGWDLGLLESMCASILVGVSVDFVVHFAHAWVSGNGGRDSGGNGGECSRRDELVARTHTSLSTVGVSVLSAGLTTMIAAFVLFFGVIIFFAKFGAMLALAMGFSLLYSVVFFHALVTMAGPSDGCCSLCWQRRQRKPAEHDGERETGRP